MALDRYVRTSEQLDSGEGAGLIPDAQRQHAVDARAWRRDAILAPLVRERASGDTARRVDEEHQHAGDPGSVRRLHRAAAHALRAGGQRQMQREQDQRENDGWPFHGPPPRSCPAVVARDAAGNG